MSRVQQQLATTDGGAFYPLHRPPAELIPEPFKAGLAEFDQLVERQAHVNHTLRELTEGYGAAMAAASREDAKAIAAAARAGQPLPEANLNAKAVDQQIDDARRSLAALKGAVEMSYNDLADVREAERANPAHVQRVEKARAELRQATAALAVKAKALVRVLAVYEWLEFHRPYDESIRFDVGELAHEMRGQLHTRGHTAPLEHLLQAIDNL